MNLHIFNPEHEIALAYNKKYMVAPHAAQELRMNLGWIPALWAEDGDVVLVDDAKFAIKASQRMKTFTKDVLYLERNELRDFQFDCVKPWGWNLALRTMLEDYHVSGHILPSDERLAGIRRISNRCQANAIIPLLRNGLERKTCGESFIAVSLSEVNECLKKWHHIVMKAPWSSSGRGVRYAKDSLLDVTGKWVNNIIRQQGSMTVEPYYNKVMDFGMEFEAHYGKVEYCGLSLFQTVNGAYKGNILASEAEKAETLRKYMIADVAEKVKSRICERFPDIMDGIYEGPFGVDMMIVSNERGGGFLLHPCVEINVRRTMGHVALTFPATDLEPKRIMQVVHDVNYQLRISNLENNFVQTI